MSWYDDFGANVQQNVPLAPRTWFNLGGPARFFCTPSDIPQLRAMLQRVAEQNINVLVLGGGANLLVRDAGVDAAVFHLNQPAFTQITREADNRIRVGAGKDVQELIMELTRLGLSGLECLAGIPGSVGGEVRMNAGGQFGDIGSAVETVTVLEANGTLDTLTRDEIEFGYRQTNISAKFILEATFKMTEDDPQRVLNKVKEIWMYKKGSQPLAQRSAGCIFRNPEGQRAGALIDQAGLKGYTVGGASVSDKHANFICANADAKAADVLAVIAHIKRVVAEKFGVELQSEVVIW